MTRQQQAAQYGQDAFKRGAKRVPIQCAHLMTLVNQGNCGDFHKLMKTWLSAWDSENLK